MSIETLKSTIVEKLKNENANCKKQWTAITGTLTSYFYVDNLLPDEIATAIYDAFPQNGENFYQRKNFREKKKTFAHLTESSPILSDITSALQTSEVMREISIIAGMDKLESDPSLYAGGLSMMFKGDFLNPHIDNSHDGGRKRYRRLNILYYVSPNWKMEYGGNLELWDDKVFKPETVISKFNRLVVMETNDRSWHSVSPVIEAENKPRCCVSNYYFSSESPSGSDYFHVTSFTGRPGEYGKRVFCVFDNLLRNTVSKILKFGRGKKLVNAPPKS